VWASNQRKRTQRDEPTFKNTSHKKKKKIFSWVIFELSQRQMSFSRKVNIRGSNKHCPTEAGKRGETFGKSLKFNTSPMKPREVRTAEAEISPQNVGNTQTHNSLVTYPVRFYKTVL
jgi:hypothetical protein